MKPTETFQYTFFTTCHPQGAKKAFVKVEALRLLRKNSLNKTFEEKTKQLKKTLPHLKNTVGREAIRKTLLTKHSQN